MHYTIAQEERPGYAHAIAGLARIALAANDYQKAINLYLQADSLMTDYSFKEELIEAYTLTGQKDKAQAISKQVIEGMTKDAQMGEADESIGHYADNELAYAYLRMNDNEKALKHALLEYNRRPENIDVNETVAWVYYCNGDFKKALPYLNVALKTNSKNPTLLCRAGLIYAKAGERGLAKKMLQEALKNNPNIAESLKTKGAAELRLL